MPDHNYSLRLDEELYQTLQEQTADKEVDVSGWIRCAIRQRLEREQTEPTVEERLRDLETQLQEHEERLQQLENRRLF